MGEATYYYGNEYLPVIDTIRLTTIVSRESRGTVKEERAVIVHCGTDNSGCGLNM